MPEDRNISVEFVLIAEAGILESQALLLCESIRRFAGAYARCPLTVVSPRPAHRPCATTLRELERLDAEYLPLEIESALPKYGPSYRVHGLASVERRPGPAVIVQLDSDTMFVDEPDLSLDRTDAAARPVDVKGMCTTGPGDPFDDYWRRLCALLGVDYDRVPVIQTTVDRYAVRASYNAGLIAARRSRGIFQRTESFLRKLAAAGMMSWTNNLVVNSGTGLLQGAATAYWGTSQAAFSLAAVAGNHEVRLLPPTYNFPLHLADEQTAGSCGLVHIHYHHLLNGANAGTLRLIERMGRRQDIREWLMSRLPLDPTAATNGRTALEPGSAR